MKKFPKIDTVKFRADFSGYKYVISFVGNPNKDEALAVLCDLVKVFKNKLNIFSIKKDFEKSVEKIKKENLLDEEDLKVYLKCQKAFEEDDLTQIYNASKINLNIFLGKKTAKNLELFEILVSGGFVITNEANDLKKYFEASKHLETYKNSIDLIDKIEFYLRNLNIAQKIAQLGRFEVIKNVTK